MPSSRSARRSSSTTLPTTPDIVFVGPYLTFEIANELSAGLRERDPGVSIVLVHENKAAIDGWLDELGADSVISPTATDEEVLQLVERLGASPADASVVVELAVDSGDGTPIATVSESDAPDDADVPDIAPVANDGATQIIAVVSPKGGLGKTTSPPISRSGSPGLPRSVVLVDADVQFGDVATALGSIPRPHAARHGGRPRAARHDGAQDLPHAASRPASTLSAGPSLPPTATGSRATSSATSSGSSPDIFRFVIVDTDAGPGRARPLGDRTGHRRGRVVQHGGAEPAGVAQGTRRCSRARGILPADTARRAELRRQGRAGSTAATWRRRSARRWMSRSRARTPCTVDEPRRADPRGQASRDPASKAL